MYLRAHGDWGMWTWMGIPRLRSMPCASDSETQRSSATEPKFRRKHVVELRAGSEVLACSMPAPLPPAWAGSELAEPSLASEPQGGREPRACGRAWRANSRVMDASSASAIYLPRFFFFLPPAELIRKVFFWRTVCLFSLSLSFLGLVRCCSHHSSRFSRVRVSHYLALKLDLASASARHCWGPAFCSLWSQGLSLSLDLHFHVI